MFAAAVGDVNALQSILAADVTCYSDGGGKVAAASKPFFGAQAVIKFILGTARFRSVDAIPHVVTVNGSYGLFIADSAGDTLLTIGCDNGKLTELFIQRNPEKLAGLRRALFSQ